MRPMRIALVLVAAAASASCELKEASLTEPERVVVAEAFVRVNLGPALGVQPGPSISVFLHETLGTTGGSGPVPGAQIAITRTADGLRIPLDATALADCVIVTPVDQSGTCYTPRPGTPAVESIAPNDRLSLRIDLPGGGVLASETVVPGRFDLLNVVDAATCVLEPLTASDIVWSRSAGAWAYVADTFIHGLSASFAPDKVKDPLYLQGLAVSSQDTAIVFPREFGVFARGDLDFDVTAMLQKGLPPNATATVSVAAVDRNWVNWARGGNFNPSGVVRVPSVRGDGTGVFGSTVVRSFRVAATPGGIGKKCPPAPAVTP